MPSIKDLLNTFDDEQQQRREAYFSEIFRGVSDRYSKTIEPYLNVFIPPSGHQRIAAAKEGITQALSSKPAQEAFSMLEALENERKRQLEGVPKYVEGAIDWFDAPMGAAITAYHGSPHRFLPEPGAVKKNLVTRAQLIAANAEGLTYGYDAPSYHTPILDAASRLGQDGISIADSPVVTGWRRGGAPDFFISRNHREDVSELGLSMMAIGADDPHWSDMWMGDRDRTEYSGILVPVTGSDDEPLLLVVDAAENFDL